ncbi:ribonuclease-like [Chelydra serpentina]|uniref:Ribonuclease-like n=1 Tax=Chelydra serpentina TaxID=8475 RepID=A0A8T1S0H7_CHESE|nr:ribonuclease-like [Chelydra serpentina]
MAVRRPHLQVLLPLVLLATCLALATGSPWTRLNKIFRKHHVDFPKTQPGLPNSYCDMMFERGIDGRFKNTFIHAPMRSIKRVCSVGGVHISTGLRKSIFQFRVTTCRYKPLIGSYTAKTYSRHIIIACWNRLPVLYVE